MYWLLAMGQPSRNLWTSEPVSANVAAGAMGNDNNQIFAHSLTTTLGYLNTTYGTPEQTEHQTMRLDIHSHGCNGTTGPSYPAWN